MTNDNDDDRDWMSMIVEMSNANLAKMEGLSKSADPNKAGALMQWENGRAVASLPSATLRSFLFARRAKDAADAFVVQIDQHQIGAYAAERAGATLLPSANLLDGETKGIGEVFLREPGLATDRFNVEFSRNMKPRRFFFATRNGDRLAKASGDFVASFLCHGRPLFALTFTTFFRYSATSSFVSIARAFRSPWLKSTRSPFAKTVIRKTGRLGPVKKVMMRKPPLFPFP